MPNLFARQTALSDVNGRLDYISNPMRQEHQLAVYDGAAGLLDGQFWQILAKESQAAFKQSGVKTRMVKTKSGELIEQDLQCVEGRELFFLLGNELLERLTPDEILKTAVDAVSEKVGRPAAGALQFNDDRTSLHVHVIFPERELLKDPVVKVAERNLFFDADGKRRYKKAEILDEEGQLLPGCQIIKKGEIYETRCFGSVDPKFSRKGWLKEVKTDCVLKLRNGALKGNVEITEYDPSTGMLPQQYIGKALYEKNPEQAKEVARYNAMVRKFNDAVQRGVIDQEQALMIQQAVLQADRKNEELAYHLARSQEILEDEMAQQAQMKALQQAQKKPTLSSVIAGAAARSGGSNAGVSDGLYWQKYKEIRDQTWETFIQGQRDEFKAIRDCRNARTVLDLQNSHAEVKNGVTVGWKLNKRSELEESGYFEQRDRIREDLNRHKGQLAAQRKYQEVAKGRQKIVRALLLAGADDATVQSAMREYEAAMKLLQNHVQDPNFDFENRRLKAAQTSLALAQGRAERYIKKLEEKKLQEENPLEQQAEKEYQDFQKGETTPGSEKEKAATPVRQSQFNER